MLRSMLIHLPTRIAQKALALCKMSGVLELPQLWMWRNDLAFDNGRVHHSIPYNSITAAVYGQDFDGRKKKRIRVSPEFYNMKPCVEEDSCRVEEDSCLPSVKLAVQLMKEASANQKKGWLQEALGLSTGKHLNHTKKWTSYSCYATGGIYCLKWCYCNSKSQAQNEIQMKQKVCQAESAAWPCDVEVAQRSPRDTFRPFVLSRKSLRYVATMAFDNGFLGSSGSIHVEIRKELDETATGLCRKDCKVIPAPCPS